MCRYIEADPPTFSSYDRLRARKPHECVECGATIRPGETYRRFKGMSDGYAFSDATCDTCDQWKDAYLEAHRQHCGENPGWIVGDLWTDIAAFAAEHFDYARQPTAPLSLRATPKRVSTLWYGKHRWLHAADCGFCAHVDRQRNRVERFSANRLGVGASA